MKMSVFVTVGTTSFDDMIEEVSSEFMKQVLQDLGYSRLVIQLGRGKIKPEQGTFGRLSLEWYDYKATIAADIAAADLVISHAGAGSCLEVLAVEKPLVVVVNEKLMENHQYELAIRLSTSQHLLYCTPSTLLGAISMIKRREQIPLPPTETENFKTFMDNYFGLG